MTTNLQVLARRAARKRVRSAMAAADARNAAAAPLLTATAMSALSEGKTRMKYNQEPKVHLFLDNSEERIRGRPMKDIFCRGNSGNKITNNPDKVTCQRCLDQMASLSRSRPPKLKEGNTDMEVRPAPPEPRKLHWRMMVSGNPLCRPRACQNNEKGFRNPKFAKTVEEITCIACSNLLPLREAAAPARADPPYPMPEYTDLRELDQELEAETTHANMMAEMLQFAMCHLEDDRTHVIAILGTQISVGDVIRGALALHEARRARVQG